MICVDNNLRAIIHKRTNAEGGFIYKGDWRGRYVKIKKFTELISLIYGYKTKTKNVFVSMQQKDGHPLFYEIMRLQTFHYCHIVTMHMKENKE